MMPLDDITIVYRSLQPDTPLPPNDPRYVPLAEARGEPEGGWRKKLERQLRFADTARTFLIFDSWGSESQLNCSDFKRI